MRALAWLLAPLALGGCFFDRSGLAPPGGDGGPAPADARVALDAPMTPTDARPDPVDTGPPLPEGWLDPAWRARHRLVFDNAASDEDLLDFPVLVTLDSARVDLAEAGPGGVALRFVDPDGTPLAHEVERWDPSGLSHVWVRVPRVDAASTEDFVWMYTDNPSATDGQDPAGVWSSAHRGVWHLTDGFEDATPHANHGSASAAVDAEGVIGRARRFDRGQPSVVPDAPSLDLTEAVTISAWMRPTSLSHQLGVLAKRVGCGNEGNYAVFIRNDDEIQFEHYDGNWRTFHEGSLETDRWQWVAATFDTTTDVVQIYLDGAATGDPMTGNRELIPDDNPIELGQNGGCAGDYMEGDLDEIRLEAVARSPAWIAAQHRSMTDAFLTVGAAERLP